MVYVLASLPATTTLIYLEAAQGFSSFIEIHLKHIPNY